MTSGTPSNTAPQPPPQHSHTPTRPNSSPLSHTQTPIPPYTSAHLTFRDVGTFKIVQFTDLHVQNGDPADLATASLMAEVLDAEKPDLVVLTGDVIYGTGCRIPLQSWTRAVAPIIERQLPWAAVFGNHDDEGSATREQLLAHQLTLPGCLTSRGAAGLSGVANYTLEITGTKPDARAAAVLYFLDSHSYADAAHTEYAWIQQDQIDWFSTSAAALALPSLVFFHIPLPEYDEVWNMGHCEGSKHEAVCCPKFNSGFFSAMKASGNVLGTFVGHDHVNDFSGELAGLRLCYGRASGYNTYGDDRFPRGARVITLREGARTFETRVVPRAGEPRMTSAALSDEH